MHGCIKIRYMTAAAYSYSDPIDLTVIDTYQFYMCKHAWLSIYCAVYSNIYFKETIHLMIKHVVNAAIPLTHVHFFGYSYISKTNFYLSITVKHLQ